MSLVSRFSVGSLSCACLNAGSLALDGGAMFGVVPKPLWTKSFEPDEHNRIRLALRCLLIEHRDGPILIDTGIGNKEDEKFSTIYGVDNSGGNGGTMLEDALSEAGFEPADIEYVINTHLHFDHAGGNTRVDPARSVNPRVSFPNATYVVQRGELESATSANERTAASYLPANISPVTEAGAWRLVDGETELLPGILLVPTPGHTPHHQSILISDSGDAACFAGDCMPTTAHVPLPWMMAYDLEPLVTLETKRRLLARAESDSWMMIFEHDPAVAAARVERDDKSYRAVPLDTPSGGA